MTFRNVELLAPTTGTRVLSAHWNAVIDSWGQAGMAMAVGGLPAAAKVIAEAVITATDDKARWVVVSRGLIYGPYATCAAARKAIDSGHLGTSPGESAQISVLIPAPKKERKK